MSGRGFGEESLVTGDGSQDFPLAEAARWNEGTESAGSRWSEAFARSGDSSSSSGSGAGGGGGSSSSSGGGDDGGSRGRTRSIQQQRGFVWRPRLTLPYGRSGLF